jgi:hypothetical protein
VAASRRPPRRRSSSSRSECRGRKRRRRRRRQAPPRSNSKRWRPKHGDSCCAFAGPSRFPVVVLIQRLLQLPRNRRPWRRASEEEEEEDAPKNNGRSSSNSGSSSSSSSSNNKTRSGTQIVSVKIYTTQICEHTRSGIFTLATLTQTIVTYNCLRIFAGSCLVLRGAQ